MSNNLIELQNVCAILGRTQVLDHVNLQLREGEILGLWGDNGSGKSALVSLLAGVHALSQGQILLDGKAYCPSSPSDAQRRGVQTIFQQPALLPNLSVAEKPACAQSAMSSGSVPFFITVISLKQSSILSLSFVILKILHRGLPPSRVPQRTQHRTVLRFLFLAPYTQRPHERRRVERFFDSSYHIFPALPRVRQARYAFRAAKTYISGRLFAPAQILWYALFCKIVGKQVASPRIFGIRTRHVFIS